MIKLLMMPDTLLKWHKPLIAQKYDSSHLKKRPLGRPRLAKAVRDQVLRFAKLNHTWGYEQISDELSKVNIEACSTTASNVLNVNGLAGGG